MTVKQDIAGLTGLKNGDRQAFGSLFYAYKDKLHGFLYGITRSEEQAADLLQDIFLKLWKERAHLPEIENFDAYLFSMAKHLAVDVLRRNARGYLLESLLQQDENQDTMNPEHILIGKEVNDHIRNAIRQLPPQQQKVFVLYKQQGFSHEEIAKSLNVSVSTSKNTLRNALANLRKMLSRIYPDLPVWLLLFVFSR
ncbi:MAG: RNA polymerase sigma factor [Dysgonamonadaceae bacterium]|jgi:RNA polymerase sigma-70 factor (ECF subfamily)|nr:RNA polymerase sigma factor [Dysgonamonadaceae bacterium]